MIHLAYRVEIRPLSEEAGGGSFPICRAAWLMGPPLKRLSQNCMTPLLHGKNGLKRWAGKYPNLISSSGASASVARRIFSDVSTATQLTRIVSLATARTPR